MFDAEFTNDALIVVFRGERPRSIAEINPSLHYSRSSLSEIRFHRGVELVHLLTRDPLAPKGRSFNNSIVTLGLHVIEYASEFQVCLPTEVDRERDFIVGDAQREAMKILSSARLQAATLDAQARRQSLEDVKAEALVGVSRLIEKLSHLVSGENNIISNIGVYFLFLRGRIQYIGQSKNILGRCAVHRRDDSKLFDQIKFLPCSVDDLSNIEGFLIRLINPPLNKWDPERNVGAPNSILWRELVDITQRVLM